MKLVTTFHQPSSVLCSVKCRLSTRDLEHLVVARPNRVEVYSLQTDGLNLECTHEVWGRALSLRALPIPGSTRSNLVVMLDHPEPELIFLAYSESAPGTGALSSKKSLSLKDRGRPAEFFNDIIVDPRGKAVVASCYIGKLKVIDLSAGNYKNDFDVTLPELNILSMAFLDTPSVDERTIGILYHDHQSQLALVARELHLDDLDLQSQPATLLPRTIVSVKPGTSSEYPFKLVPVPPFAESESEGNSFRGGALVLGQRKIMLYEFSTPEWQQEERSRMARLNKRKTSAKKEQEAAAVREKEKGRENKKRKTRAAVPWPWSDVASYCALEGTARYLIADCYGRTAMLCLDFLDKHGLVLIPLGRISSPTSLTYLTNQFIFVGSHLGDSQLVKLNPTATGDLRERTLPIPSDIKTVPPSALTGGSPSNKGKGKKRAFDGDDDKAADTESETAMDVDDVEQSFEQKEMEKGEIADKGRVVDARGNFLTVTEAWKNIAPILDAIVVDVADSGQKQIVTCSGGRSTGSVNVVRNGADFRELAIIRGVEDVINIFSLRLRFKDELDTHIAFSTSNTTHVLQLNGAGSQTMTRVEQTATGHVLHEPTIAMANVTLRSTLGGSSSYREESAMVVQVTKSGAFLLEYNEAFQQWIRIAAWELQTQNHYGAPVEIIAADINPSQILLALTGCRVYLLNIRNPEKPEFNELYNQRLGRFGEDLEVAAVSCAPFGNSKYFTNRVAVAFWGSNRIQVYSVKGDGFGPMDRTDSLPAVVRSLLWHNFVAAPSPEGEASDSHPPCLFAGLGDGSVVSFTWKAPQSGGVTRQLRDRKILALGHAPVRVCKCDVEGQPAIFASGSQATVFSLERRRLKNSPIMLKDTLSACRLNAPSFESALMLANPTGLFIGNVNNLNKMHIRSVPLGLDVPRRILYDPTRRAFGVSCTRFEPVRVGEAEIVSSLFRLLEDVTFNPICQFNAEADEEITASITTAHVDGETSTVLYLLGSMIYHPSDIEPKDGRIVVLGASSVPNSSTLQLDELVSEKVGGCVYAISVVGDLICAAINSSVVLYKLSSTVEQGVTKFELQKFDEWNRNYFVTCLASNGTAVAVGDRIGSVSLLKVVNEKLEVVARDREPLWPMAIECTESNIVGGNDVLNLFSFRLEESGGQHRFVQDGSYHLNDLVTKYIRDTLIAPDAHGNVALEGEHIIFTSSGRISIIVNVTKDELAQALADLQRNLAYVVEGPGELTLPQFRAPKSVRGRREAGIAAYGFLDGDFLETFLTRAGSPEGLEEVISGHNEEERLAMPADEIFRVIEALQSLH
ncbi:hypothetical protein HGRIS_005855 [Hohenbuehelia grisea]|uniref:DNA damage-binding protein 1 n=1 Tax=Hohenbuehelia grisea TaxID=104357 RepID=A0ABR3JZ57_9AGAR